MYICATYICKSKPVHVFALRNTDSLLGFANRGHHITNPNNSLAVYKRKIPQDYHTHLHYLGVSENYGYPQIIHFNRVFHYKPSILGYPCFRKHPFEPIKKRVPFNDPLTNPLSNWVAFLFCSLICFFISSRGSFLNSGIFVVHFFVTARAVWKNEPCYVHGRWLPSREWIHIPPKGKRKIIDSKCHFWGIC